MLLCLSIMLCFSALKIYLPYYAQYYAWEQGLCPVRYTINITTSLHNIAMADNFRKTVLLDYIWNWHEKNRVYYNLLFYQLITAAQAVKALRLSPHSTGFRTVNLNLTCNFNTKSWLVTAPTHFNLKFTVSSINQ